MPRSVLWGIAGVTAAAAALALAFVLWRQRRSVEGRWKTADYLVAIGIALALFGGVLSLLAASNDGKAESADVTSFRSDVRTACRALALNGQGLSLANLVNANGDIDRQRLVDALTAQLDAGVAILGNVWAKPVPDQLTADVAEAHRTADVVLSVERTSVNAIGSQLSDPAPLDQVLNYLQGLTTQNLANATAFEAAMSKLAGQDCRPIPPSS